jgi:hypothetical protein
LSDPAKPDSYNGVPTFHVSRPEGSNNGVPVAAIESNNQNDIENNLFKVPALVIIDDSLALKVGQQPLTRTDGSIVSAAANGLVIDTGTRGKVTIAYTAIAAQATASSSTRTIKSTDLDSYIAQALDTMHETAISETRTYDFSTTPSASKTPSRTRNGSGGRVELGSGINVYAYCLALITFQFEF